MAWVTDAELTTAVTDATGGGTLADSWSSVVTWANLHAYNRLLSVLGGRGYSAAQLADWDDRVQWNTRLGVCLAVRQKMWRGEGYDWQVARDEYEAITEELKAVIITIDGVPVDPANGRLTYGTYSTSHDTHTLDDVL